VEKQLAKATAANAESSAVLRKDTAEISALNPKFSFLRSGDETHARSITKAVSYRILGSATTGAIAYFVSKRNINIALLAGASDFVLKIALYFVHDQIWTHIPWGYKNHGDNGKNRQ
jgi:uncharacterized membrane protein